MARKLLVTFSLFVAGCTYNKVEIQVQAVGRVTPLVPVGVEFKVNLSRPAHANPLTERER